MPESKRLQRHGLSYGRMSIFLVILAAILFSLSYFVFDVLQSIFSALGPATAFWLGIAIFSLTASFLAASIIGFRYYNVFTRIYYTISAVWMGLFGYLVLATILYDLIRLSGFLSPLSLSLFGEFLLFAAILAAAYGVFHARMIKIKRVSVPLKNVPESWRGKQIAWISDVHLGQLHGPAFALRVRAGLDALKPDIVFIGGDLFDGTGAPDANDLMAPFKGLRAPSGVYYISGNHEEFGDGSNFFKAVEAAGFKILKNELVEVDGLQIIGVDYADASHPEQFQKILASLDIDHSKPSILLKHEPSDLQVAEAAGITFQISGHTHRGQQWPFMYLAQWRYKGYAYGLKAFKAMQVYVSSGVGSWGPPVRVGTDSEIVLFSFASNPDREHRT